MRIYRIWDKTPLLVLLISMYCSFLCMTACEKAVDPKHVSIYVNGLDEDSSRNEAHKLSMYVYIVPPQAPSRVCSCSGEKIIPYLTNRTLLNGNGMIRTVIFCHEHGAKLVRNSLDSAVLRGALNKTYPSGDIDKIVAKIRNQVAVITFGGDSVMPLDQAKLVLNFQLEEDLIIEANPRIHLKEQKDGDSTITVHSTRPDPRTAYYSSSSCSGSSGDGDTCGLDKYLRKKEVIDTISEKLEIENPYHM